jgi:hypothetical protein
LHIFSSRNYGLYLDQLQMWSLESERLAEVMGEALAVMHWSVGIDARDVKFVLGGSPEARRNRVNGEEICSIFDELGYLPSTMNIAPVVWRRAGRC